VVGWEVDEQDTGAKNVTDLTRVDVRAGMNSRNQENINIVTWSGSPLLGNDRDISY
jgi:hypothetical protein